MQTPDMPGRQLSEEQSIFRLGFIWVWGPVLLTISPTPSILFWDVAGQGVLVHEVPQGLYLTVLSQSIPPLTAFQKVSPGLTPGETTGTSFLG